jgi:hypothetical protein
MVGLPGFEPGTSRLSGGRSNQLSYRPVGHTPKGRLLATKSGNRGQRPANADFLAPEFTTLAQWKKRVTLTHPDKHDGLTRH